MSTDEIWVSAVSARLHGRIEPAIAGRENAPWLTCLHSLATDLHLWDAQISALSEHFQILRLDLRGHGLSSSAVDSFTLNDLSGDVVEVWDQLGVTESAILGLSIGGMTALMLALTVPGRVTRLVAADCRADAPDAFREIWTQRQHMLRDQGMDAIVEATLPTWFTAQSLLERPSYIPAVEHMIRATSVNGYLGATRALQQLQLKEHLMKISCPTMFLVGEQDGVHPQAMKEMQQLTPGSVLVSLPEAAHLSNLEQPALFLDAVLPFLRAQMPAIAPSP